MNHLNTTTTRKRQQGFSLIELMIVVAIVGILGTVAMPALQNYMVRARVVEGLSFAAAAKSTVAENAVSGATDLAGGVEKMAATKNVEKLEVDKTSGLITITMTAAAKDVVLKLRPQTKGAPEADPADLVAGVPPAGPIIWTCWTEKEDDFKYVPSECRQKL